MAGLLGKIYNNNTNSKKRSKNYKIREESNFNFKESCFYFSNEFRMLSKKQYKIGMLRFKKNISFFKKVDNVNKWFLFWTASRIFTDTIFTKIEFNLYSFYVKQKSRYINQLNMENPTKVINFKYKFIKLLYENRSIFKKIFFKKMYTQRRLSYKIINFLKLNQRAAILNLELGVENILLRSRFFLTKSHLNLALSNNIVYLNGALLINKNKVVKVSDVLQLSVINSYFYFDRFIIQDIKRLKSKLPSKI